MTTDGFTPGERVVFLVGEREETGAIIEVRPDVLIVERSVRNAPPKGTVAREILGYGGHRRVRARVTADRYLGLTT